MSNPEYDLRWPTRLSDEDRQQLLSLYDEVARWSLAGEVERNIIDTEAESLEQGHLHVLTVYDIDGLAGSIVFQPHTLQSRKHVVHARRAVIAQRAQGKLLHQAMAECIRKLLTLGFEIVTCDVAADSPVEMWKSLGFKEYGILPDYVRRDGRSFDGHFLYLRLTPFDESSSAAGHDFGRIDQQSNGFGTRRR